MAGQPHATMSVTPGERPTLPVAHPERHGDLMVRVAGFSEYFVRLLPEVQQEIIRRVQQGAEE